MKIFDHRSIEDNLCSIRQLNPGDVFELENEELCMKLTELPEEVDCRVVDLDTGEVLYLPKPHRVLPLPKAHLEIPKDEIRC